MSEIDPSLPEVVRRFLASGAKVEEIRLDAEGRWWHEGEPFVNERLARLFSRSVGRTEGGTWVLTIGQYTYPCVVEDVGFFVERLRVEGEGGDERVWLVLSDEREELLDPATLRYRADDRLVCAVKGGRFEAKLARGPHHSLLDRAESRGEVLGLEVMGVFVPLG